MNQAGQLQLCAVMLAEARLVGRKVGEDVFVEAGINYFSCIFEVVLRRKMGAIVCWGGFGTFFYGWGILWHPSSLGEYHQSERRGTEQLGRGLVRRGFLQESCWDAIVSWALFGIELFE